MSDTSQQFVPTVSLNRTSTSSRNSAQDNAMDVGARVRLITQINPYMADRPDVLLQMGQSGLATPDLIDQAGQMYGMMAANTFASRLASMSPGQQRSIWATLPKSQQMALEQMKYSPPPTREESWLGKALGPIDELAGKGLHGLGDVVMPALTPVLKGLAWVGDRPAHIYRTIRTLDDNSQWAGLAGAIAGGLAIAAALPTGGASLLVAGAVGLGAVGGAGALSLGASSITNPGDWFRAFADTYHGEKAFDRPSREKADELLGDPRLVGLAQDMANLEGFSVNDLATELAGQRGTGINDQLAKIDELATRFGGLGTPEFQQAKLSMLNALKEPLFLEAVTRLQQGKISIGRDVADTIGLDPSSTLHSIVSGALDAAFVVAVDPTIMLGGVSKWNRARQLGVKVGAEGSVAAEEFLRVAADPRVRRFHNVFVDAFNAGDLQRMTSMTPEMLREVPALSQYREALKAYKVIDSNADFTTEHLLAYFTGSSNLAPLMRGVGTVRGANGIVLKGLSRRSEFVREMFDTTRTFVGAMGDPRLERHLDDLIEKATKAGDTEVLDKLGTVRSNMIDLETGKIYGRHQVAARAGRIYGNTAGRLPVFARVPEVLQSMSTMVPAGRAIALVGEQAPRDVRALAELGRYMGMPSYMRRTWANTILFSDNVAGRMNAVHGWLDNALTIAGARQTEHGAALVDKYLFHSLQTYGVGDEVVVNGRALRLGLFENEQADKIVMPSLHELHRAAATGHIGQLVGAVDASIIDSAVTKIWKPAVLLRIGFIPRAAGEELLNFMFRGGFGGLVQEFGARSIGRERAYLEAVAKRARDPRTLSTLENSLLAHGPIGQLPAHIRPLARMLAAYDFAEPVVNSMFHYSAWLRQTLDKGLGTDAVTAGLKAIAGEGTSMARLNLAGNLDSILLGNKHSWRRMLQGGVDDDLVKAAIAYQSQHSTALMKRVSTRSAGVWDPGYDETQVQRRLMKKGDDLVEQQTIILRGQPGIYSKNSWEYVHGLHHDMVSKVEDPIGGHVARRYLTRVRGGTNIADDQIDQLFDLTQKIEMDVPKRVLHEFLGSDNPDHVRAMVAELEKVEPEVAQHLAMFLPKSGPIAIDDVIDAVHQLAIVNQGREWERVYARMVGELEQVRSIHNIVSGLDANTRGFAAAMVRNAEYGQSDGLATAWRAHRAGVADSPFVERWADLNDEIVADVRNRLQSVAHQDAAMHTQRISGLPEGDPLKEGTILAWRAPSLKRFRSVDEVAQHATNRAIIEENRDLVLRLLHEPDDRLGLLADRALAEQLGVVTGSPVRAHTLPRSVKEGRVELGGGLVPAAKHGDETVMWSVNQQMFPAEASSVFEDLDARAQQMAEDMVGRMRQLWTRGNVTHTVARGRPVATEIGDVVDTPMLFTRNPMSRAGELESVAPGTILDPSVSYFDAKGKRVDISRPEFSHQVEWKQGEGQAMWAAMGPAVEDHIDIAEGLLKFRPKADVTFREGEIIPSSDIVPMFRARPEQVLDVGEGLPTTVTAPRIVGLEQSTWERFVRRGFDDVIGPSIDAIARQPMAFHFFAERYAFSMKAQSMLHDPELVGKLETVAQRISARPVDMDVDALLLGARQVAMADGKIPEAAKWTTARTSAWLRGHTPDELDKLLAGVIARNTGKAGVEERAALEAAYKLRLMGADELLGTAGAQLPTGSDLLSYVQSKLRPRDLESTERLLRSDGALQTINTDNILSKLTDEDWSTVVAAYKNQKWAHEAAGEYAAVAAINDMLPFIDSHEFKTQFAEMGRGFLPFWYAEENFIKRWGRTLIDQGTLQVARKAQLSYMGLRNAGVVRTDVSGRDYFVYPGSTLLAEAVGKLIPGDLLPVGAMFQTPTSSMLPGLNNNFGTPSFSPLVSFPLGVAEAYFPEMQSVQRALLGDYAASKSAWEQLIPTQLQNFFEAVSANADSSQRYSSAMMSAIAQLEASGKGIDAGASPGQVDEYMRKVRAHARIILVAQALTGFVAPGPPSQVTAGASANITGIGIDDPRNVLSSAFQNLVRSLGIEQGTVQFLELYPLANLEDIVAPTLGPDGLPVTAPALALTQGMSVSRSGAPLPATAEAMGFYAQNEAYMQEFPDAGPWLLPQTEGGERSQYAYDQQTINGLRQRETPEDFLTSIKFKEAAGPYFRARTTYLNSVDRATVEGNDALVDQLKQNWTVFSSTWKAAHPIFAEELESSAGRQRRARVIEQMSTIINDPSAPQSPQFGQLQVMMKSFQNYKLQLAILGEDRSAAGRARVEQLKAGFSKHMDGLSVRFPTTQAFWTSVLRPESSLD